MVDETTPAAAPVDAPTKTPLPRAQVVWLVIYWWALLPCSYLFLSAVVGQAELYQIGIVLMSLTATVIGVIFAMRIARAGVTNAQFIKGTTTVRVIAVAWILLGFVLIWVPVIETFAGVSLNGEVVANSFLGTLGSLSVLAIVGPGYSEARETLAGARKPLP